MRSIRKKELLSEALGTLPFVGECLDSPITLSLQEDSTSSEFVCAKQPLLEEIGDKGFGGVFLNCVQRLRRSDLFVKLLQRQPVASHGKRIHVVPDYAGKVQYRGHMKANTTVLFLDKRI